MGTKKFSTKSKPVKGSQRGNEGALRTVRQKVKSGKKLTAREDALRKGDKLPDPSSNKSAKMSGVKPVNLKIKPNNPKQTSGRPNNFKDVDKTIERRRKSARSKLEKGSK